MIKIKANNLRRFLKLLLEYRLNNKLSRLVPFSFDDGSAIAYEFFEEIKQVCKIID